MVKQENIDALLFTIENFKKEKQALSQLAKEITDTPWGVLVKNISKDEIQHLLNMKCDFVVLLPEKAPAHILKQEGIGKVLQIDPSFDNELVRTIHRLSINAVLFSPGNDTKYPLTVHQLMIYERLIGGTGKHILALMPADMPIDDLESLWDLGARGIVVDIISDNYKDRLYQIQEAITKLPLKKRKTSDKFSALLPRSIHQPTAEEPGEEDDDDI